MSGPAQRLLAKLYFELQRPVVPGEIRKAELRGEGAGRRIVWLAGIGELAQKVSSRDRAAMVRDLVDRGFLGLEEPVHVPGKRGPKATAISAPAGELAFNFGVETKANSPIGSETEAISEPEALARAGAATPPLQAPPPAPSPNWETIRKVLERIGLRNDDYYLRRWSKGHACYAIGELNHAIRAGTVNSNDRAACGAYVFTVGNKPGPRFWNFDDWSVLERWTTGIDPRDKFVRTEPTPSAKAKAKAKGWNVITETEDQANVLQDPANEDEPTPDELTRTAFVAPDYCPAAGCVQIVRADRPCPVHEPAGVAT